MTPFAELILETPRLLLRQPALPDAPAVFALHADPEAMRWWSTPPWTDPAAGTAWVDDRRAANASGEALTLMLEDRSAGGVLGTATLFHWHRTCRRAELGYQLSRPHWGRGLMREALDALLDWAFVEAELIRVEADVDPRNLASCGLLERLGFVREGLLRRRWIVAGEVSDTAWYGLLREERADRP